MEISKINVEVLLNRTVLPPTTKFEIVSFLKQDFRIILFFGGKQYYLSFFEVFDFSRGVYSSVITSFEVFQ